MPLVAINRAAVVEMVDLQKQARAAKSTEERWWAECKYDGFMRALRHFLPPESIGLMICIANGELETPAPRSSEDSREGE